MSELLNNLFSYYKARIESPFVFNYLFFWVVWNKDFSVILFFYSGADKYYKVASYSFSVLDFLVPVFVAATFIVLLPFLNNLIQLGKYFALKKIKGVVQTHKRDYDKALELSDLKLKEQELNDEKKKIFKELGGLRDELNQKNISVENLNLKNFNLNNKVDRLDVSVKEDLDVFKRIFEYTSRNILQESAGPHFDFVDIIEESMSSEAVMLVPKSYFLRDDSVGYENYELIDSGLKPGDILYIKYPNSTSRIRIVRLYEVCVR